MRYVLGIDLSGPRNLADTYVAIFSEGETTLHYSDCIAGSDDARILQTISELSANGPLVLGIDAPLSYSQAGGDRPSDSALRRLVRERGGGVGVMPPTMIRMVYLTLRGTTLTRMIEAGVQPSEIRMVEVHPGAAMLLRGASVTDLASIRKQPSARLRLLDWLETKGLQGIGRQAETPDHFVMACGAALAAWDWSRGTPQWYFPASPPLHPYDFAC